MRYFFEITYHGGNYHGWQSQHNATGVQQVVEEALSRLLREKISIVGSGRTDTGVHCKQQFFHADISRAIDPPHLVQRMNALLGKDIAIRSIVPVTADASARYDARLRIYEYHITRVKAPLLQGLSFYYFRPLHMQNLRKATALLVGTHDFESFSKVKTDVDHFICTVKKAEWNEKGTNLVFTIAANRFLRGMVRAIVGTLLEVGSGKISVDEFAKVLKGHDRKLAGMNVPPEGLYLKEVRYRRGVFIRK